MRCSSRQNDQWFPAFIDDQDMDFTVPVFLQIALFLQGFPSTTVESVPENFSRMRRHLCGVKIIEIDSVLRVFAGIDSARRNVLDLGGARVSALTFYHLFSEHSRFICGPVKGLIRVMMMV